MILFTLIITAGRYRILFLVLFISLCHVSIMKFECSFHISFSYRRVRIYHNVRTIWIYVCSLFKSAKPTFYSFSYSHYGYDLFPRADSCNGQTIMRDYWLWDYYGYNFASLFISLLTSVNYITRSFESPHLRQNIASWNRHFRRTDTTVGFHYACYYSLTRWGWVKMDAIL